ncbi:type II toxin-antitoxin system HipA family toxin, partial [Rhizobium ruizarguesonis]
MTSQAHATAAFVWLWLPGATEPVVAGRLDPNGERLFFPSGASYRRRNNAISVYEPALPLQEGILA